MKKRTLTLIETPYINKILEGQIHAEFDEKGLIKALKKRLGGKMVSLLHEEEAPEEEAPEVEDTPTQTSLIEEIQNTYTE